MTPDQVRTAGRLLEEIEELDKVLSTQAHRVEVKAVTRKDLGQDFHTVLSLPAPHWQNALKAWREELTSRLRDLGMTGIE